MGECGEPCNFTGKRLFCLRQIETPCVDDHSPFILAAPSRQSKQIVGGAVHCESDSESDDNYIQNDQSQFQTFGSHGSHISLLL